MQCRKNFRTSPSCVRKLLGCPQRIKTNGERPHGVRRHPCGQPPPLPAISRIKPLVRLDRCRGFRQRSAVEMAGSDDLDRARQRGDQKPEGRDQCVRLRAGGVQECAARPFRLHGLRPRRRGDASRQPRGLFEIPASAAAAQRRLQGRHERRYFRHEIRLADLHRADRRQSVLSFRWGGGGREGRAIRQSSAGAVDVLELLGL